MGADLLVFFYCLAVGVTTSGLISSSVELICGPNTGRVSLLSPHFTPVHLVQFMTTGSLGFYQRAFAHGQDAMKQQPSEWGMASLAVFVASTWSFLLGLFVLNIIHSVI